MVTRGTDVVRRGLCGSRCFLAFRDNHGRVDTSNIGSMFAIRMTLGNCSVHELPGCSLPHGKGPATWQAFCGDWMGNYPQRAWKVHGTWQRHSVGTSSCGSQPSLKIPPFVIVITNILGAIPCSLYLSTCLSVYLSVFPFFTNSWNPHPLCSKGYWFFTDDDSEAPRGLNNLPQITQALSVELGSDPE